MRVSADEESGRDQTRKDESTRTEETMKLIKTQTAALDIIKGV